MKVVNRKKKECTVENIKRKWMKCRIDHEDHEGKEGISPISEHHRGYTLDNKIGLR